MVKFIVDDGTDTGKLTEVKQFDTQNAKSVEHPMYTVNKIAFVLCCWSCANERPREEGGSFGLSFAAEYVLVHRVFGSHGAPMSTITVDNPAEAFLGQHDFTAVFFCIVSIAMLATTVFLLAESSTVAGHWKTSVTVGALVTASAGT